MNKNVQKSSKGSDCAPHRFQPFIKAFFIQYVQYRHLVFTQMLYTDIIQKNVPEEIFMIIPL